MQYIAEYVKTLAVFMVFAAFVSIIAPTGAFKKYINLIVSLVLILTILQPIIKLLKGDVLDANYFKFSSIAESNALKHQARQLTEEQTRKIADIYRQEVNLRVKERIEGETGADVVSVDTVINGDYEIDEIYLTLASPVGEDDGSVLESVFLGKSQGALDGERIKKYYDKLIIKSLRGFYNVDESHIYISYD